MLCSELDLLLMGRHLILFDLEEEEDQAKGEQEEERASGLVFNEDYRGLGANISRT